MHMILKIFLISGISCAVYTGLRSAYNLYDRRNHKQSIALKDKEARASWFNIAAGTLSGNNERRKSNLFSIFFPPRSILTQ